MRTSVIERKTHETCISLQLNLDGTSRAAVDTGIGFFDHMLTLLAHHARFDLDLTCKGDLQVDGHHTVEDVGIALGQALSEALGNKAGILRYGSAILPMDESLILCALDLSGRPYLGYEMSIPSPRVGGFDTELTEEFFAAFARTGGCTLHLRQMAGSNSHHIIEGAFKAFARALRAAVSVEAGHEDDIPSTKGVL